MYSVEYSVHDIVIFPYDYNFLIKKKEDHQEVNDKQELNML